MDVEFNIDTEEVQRLLKKLPDATAKKVTRLAVSAGAREIKKKASELAPYDPKRTSGVHLRDAIVVQRLKGTNDIFVIGTKGGGKKGAPHAHLQEFGTVNQPPQPFLRPAGELALPAAISKIVKSLGTGILRESKKLAGK